MKWNRRPPKVPCVNHQQQTLHRRGLLRPEPACEASVEKAGVLRSVVLEFPSEYRFIKSFRGSDILHGHFNVVDLVLVLCLAHGCNGKDYGCGRDCKYRPGV